MQQRPIPRPYLFEDLFRDVSPGFYVRPLHGDPLPSAGQIKIDVSEDANQYNVHAELPGVRKEDIQVGIDGAVLSLSAEVKQHDEEKRDDHVLRSERYFGSVSRSIQLPQEVDSTKAVARYENGVLLLTLPKRKTGNSTRITVS